jgi:hypothetical protein
MGPGGFPSLQNWCDPTLSGLLRSIRKHSRHIDLALVAMIASGAMFFVLGKWVGKSVGNANLENPSDCCLSYCSF